ncbi:MAG: toll/interleukin-1 receptor domain-containing protein [Methanobacteriota archaeon]
MEKWESKRKILIFYSYSHLDKYDVGKLKSILEMHGFAGFLAHEDIQPSRVWEQEICEAIQYSDIFIPFLTNNFKTSTWTDQECGMAMAQNKKLMSAPKAKALGILIS